MCITNRWTSVKSSHAEDSHERAREVAGRKHEDFNVSTCALGPACSGAYCQPQLDSSSSRFLTAPLVRNCIEIASAHLCMHTGQCRRMYERNIKVLVNSDHGIRWKISTASTAIYGVLQSAGGVLHCLCSRPYSHIENAFS